MSAHVCKPKLCMMFAVETYQCRCGRYYTYKEWKALYDKERRAQKKKSQGSTGEKAKGSRR